MNILLVTMSMDIGGAETHILELAKELKRNGNNVCVASAGGKLVNELNNYSIEHIYAPLKDKKINHIYTSLKTIKRIIKEKKIEVVHAHARIPGAISGMACKQLKIPFVTTVHGMFKVNTIFKILTNWGEKTLAVSQDIKEQVIRDYKLNPEDVGVTINGIDVTEFRKDISKKKILKKELGIDENKTILMHISRLDKDSSQVAEMLIDSAEELLKNEIQLVIVGGGDRLIELQEKAKNKENVMMLGARTDINSLLNMADMFVGVSRAALEAMASEIPVILAGNSAYNQGYQGIFDESKLSNALETNFCCRKLEMINIEKLQEDIMRLKDSPDKEKMGRFNREIVEKYYSVHKMGEDCLNMYNAVLKSKN